ncbi:MAG: helix-turn-helix domain-containing protein [Synechococcus sp.]
MCVVTRKAKPRVILKFGCKRRDDRQKVHALKAKGIGATAIAKQFGIGRSTPYLILKEAKDRF